MIPISSLFRRAWQHLIAKPKAIAVPVSPAGEFTEQELAELEKAWLELIKRFDLDLGPGSVTRKDGALVIDLKTASSRGSQLHATKDCVTFKGAAGYNDAAIIATLTYFKEKNISITMQGGRGFVRRVLALAADVGVKVDPRLLATTGSQPFLRPRSAPPPETIPQRGDPNSPLTHHWARRLG